MQRYMSLLGLRVRDRVTRLEGVVSSVSFDLYGCVQLAVTPGVNERDGKLHDGCWLDFKRLEVLDQTPVMERPSFDGPGTEIGSAEKPAR